MFPFLVNHCLQGVSHLNENMVGEAELKSWTTRQDVWYEHTHTPTPPTRGSTSEYIVFCLDGGVLNNLSFIPVQFARFSLIILYSVYDEKNIQEMSQQMKTNARGGDMDSVWTKDTGRQLCVGRAGWAESVEAREQSCSSGMEVPTRAELQDMAVPRVSQLGWTDTQRACRNS